MYDRWVRASSAGQLSGSVLLDLSAAFDLVDHELLIQKLTIYGLHDEFLQWIKSYLTDRYQAVWIDHILSDFLHCKVGVPQGSILGPLLFLIFFNDLPDHIENSVDCYADDTTLTASAKTLDEIEAKLNQDCSSVNHWIRANHLKLNVEKTHVLTMGTSRRLVSLRRPLEIQMDGVILKQNPSSSEKLLGCTLQSDLKWANQINHIKASLTKRLAGLSCLRYTCPFHVRKKVAEGIFNSILVYCLPVYGGMQKLQLQELQTLQNKAARIVGNRPPRSNRKEIFRTLGWLTVNQLISYHSLIAMFKVRTMKEPPYLANLLCKTGRDNRLKTENPVLELTASSFCFRTSMEWNKLHPDLRKEMKIGQFKYKLKKWILDNIPRFIE